MHKKDLHMDNKELNQELNLEALEARLEMEVLAASDAPVETTPVSICHFW